MEPLWWMVALWVECIGLGQSPAAFMGRHELERVRHALHGQLVDFTHNHGADRRIWSPALGQRRDLYVYLPPGFDPRKQYPLAIFLHGAGQDEQFFLQSQVHHFDRAIVTGIMPPVILAGPTAASTAGRPCAIRRASGPTRGPAATRTM